MPRLIFRLALIVTVLFVVQSPAQADYIRLGDDVVPTFQAITLTLDAGQPDYSGSVRVDLSVNQATDRFYFHNEGPTLKKVTFTGPAGPVALTTEQVDKMTVLAVAGQKFDKGEYVLEIEFTNDFDTQAVSLYRMEQDGEGYSFTQFEADDARGAFPCWDEPRFKIPFQMTISVPLRHLVVANTPPLEEKTEQGWKTTVFAKTKPLPTYLLALATGPFEVIPMQGLGVPGAIYTVRGQRHLTGAALEATPPVLKALEEYFGRPYPYEKCDFVAVPEYWAGAMENPGLITYRDTVLLLDPENATVRERRGMSRIIAHELAHMWFGDLVTMTWWDDLWLNESFADWMGDKITHQVFPSYDQDISTVSDGQGVMGGDAMITAEPIRREVTDTENLMEGVGLAYNKGKAVLAMFEHYMGEEDFRTAVRAYLAEHEWGNAVAADLWRALDKASNKKVSEGLATFIEQPGFPLLQIEADEKGKVKITQSRFHNYGAEPTPMKWKIPVSVKVSVNGQVSTESVYLTGSNTTLKFDQKPDWIYPNEGARGYYRWNVDAETLRNLTEDAVEVLTAVERVELIGNLSAMLQAGIIHGDTYLAALSTLADDPEPLVVSSVLGAMSTVSTSLISTDLEPDFATYVQRSLRPAAERFGLKAKSGEKETISLMRPTLVSTLGEDGRDQEVLDYATKLARTYMQTPDAVDQSLAGIALRLAAVEGDMALFNAYKEKFESAEIPAVRSRYLSALGSFRDPKIQDEGLTYALSGALRPQELFALGQGMGGSGDAGRDKLFNWMTENYDAIMAKVPPMFASFMPFFASGCSAERLAAAEAFFGTPERANPGTEKQLAKVAEGVDQCVGLREREGAAVANYLRRGESSPE